MGDGDKYSKPFSASLRVPEPSKLFLTIEAKIIILSGVVLSVYRRNI